MNPPARARWPLLGIALLVAALWGLRAPIADRLLPRSATERLLADAEQALATGRLSASDGSGALERYAAVLARDPDRSAARYGLERVARAALAAAEQRLADDDPGAALKLLGIAKAAGAPGLQIDALRARINAGQRSESVLRDLLDAAAQARALGNLDGGSDSALARFNEVLERDPGNALALDGRNAVLSMMLGQAQRRLDAGDDAGALALIERVDAVAPRHLGLPAARAALARHLGGAPAQDSLRRAAVIAAIHGGQLDAAQTLFDALPVVARPDAAPIRQQLASAWARRVIVESVRGRGRASRSARGHLLALAAAGEDGGLIALVDARSDDWRRRRDGALDGGDWATLISVLHGAAPADTLAGQRIMMRHCFEQGLARIALARATTCLEAMAALVARGDAAAADRARLARLYLGVAEERLGRGDVDQARRAASSARLWDPGVAGLDALRARLGKSAR